MRAFVLFLTLAWSLAAQDVPVPPSPVSLPPVALPPVPLVVESGVPLRLYLTERVPMRLGAPATAKLIEPVYAFDRIVIPAGSVVQGRVTALDSVGKLMRTQAVMGGDFTPLHTARVEFTGVTLPTGETREFHTASTVGLPTLYSEPKPQKKKVQKPAPSNNPSLHDQATRQINSQIGAQVNARTYGLGSLVRGPNKLERLQDLVYAKLPYHPQRYRRGTRFDAVLAQPLQFGSAALSPDALKDVGTAASLDRAVEVRFLSSIGSSTAKVGDRVEAALSEPLLSAANKLILPEGTLLTGTVRQARPARWFHRGGKLRFNFDAVTLPASIASLPPAPATQLDARLVGAETDPRAAVKIDSEGAAQATTPKSRLLAPTIAALIAVKSLDNDYGKPTSAGGNGAGNPGGLALGGLSGFGLLGMVAAHYSVTAGSALGMWGMAASVYRHVVSRGPEVNFDKNSSMVVRFGARPKPASP
jgi:hypothetical protein